MLVYHVKYAKKLRLSIQFSSVQSLSRVRLFATPWIAACQASLSITISRSSRRLTSIESVIPSSHLILGHPLLLLPPQYYLSLISSSRLGDGWGDLMTQKRYCFEDTWYILTPPTGEKKEMLLLTSSYLRGGFREILGELDTCHLKSRGIQGPEIWIFPEKTKLRSERMPQTSCMFTNCGYMWVFLRGKCTYVSNLLLVCYKVNC